MTRVIRRLSPDRWKILRMLPVLTNELEVCDAAFQAFVARHASLQHIMCVEDNSDMGDSYIMLDPHGRFFQNGNAGAGYFYSRPVPEIGADRAFSDVTLSPRRYSARYLTPAVMVST